MGSTAVRQRLRAAALVAALTCGTALPGVAQHLHPHTPSVSGMPQGVPYFCAAPTVTSIANGRWTDASTWSTHSVPGPNDKVAIAPGHQITYDSVADSKLDCVEV